MTLSVGIITFNEEAKLDATLRAISGIADEIIIVDSHSTDKTIDIAKSYNAKIFNEPWKGYGLQKNSVIEKCSGDWILMIDADEIASEKLCHAISRIITQENSSHIFKIKRECFCFGKKIKYGGWGRDYVIRLFRKDAGRYNDNIVHEDFVSQNKSIGTIKAPLYHHTYLNLTEYLTKFNRYTTEGAMQRKKNGKTFSSFKMLSSSWVLFIKMYIVKLGFLDGIEGYLLAKLSAAYNLCKYYKIKEL